MAAQRRFQENGADFLSKRLHVTPGLSRGAAVDEEQVSCSMRACSPSCRRRERFGVHVDDHATLSRSGEGVEPFE